MPLIEARRSPSVLEQLVFVPRTNFVQGGNQLIERFTVYHQAAHSFWVVRDDVGCPEVVSVGSFKYSSAFSVNAT